MSSLYLSSSKKGKDLKTLKFEVSTYISPSKIYGKHSAPAVDDKKSDDILAAIEDNHCNGDDEGGKWRRPLMEQTRS